MECSLTVRQCLCNASDLDGEIISPAVSKEYSELHDTQVEDDPQPGPSSSHKGIVNYEFILGVYW
ncbi:hypothetical protein E2C01_030516 [Portunus trituberculatus]|uniref:Uncharacterized protein n=1 Tax=Portunus trituberculatus TaxID=210409 RepID=A0A5B7EVY9_PORTR|nr:hypothetical protein [Portunus trituberculatus]